jgi:hypothetical protein
MPMMKSPKEKGLFSSEPNIDRILLNGIHCHEVHPKPVNNNKKQNLRISTTTKTLTKTTTMQQYVELRKRQQMLQHNTAAAILSQQPVPVTDMTQFSLSPLACRITSTIEYAILHNNNEVVRRSTSIQNKKIRQQKKVVKFATNQNVTILYDVDTAALSRKASVALFWYTAQDYTKFRTESNDMATYASGDLDYQQFFMNTLYPYCCHTASTIISGNKTMTDKTGNNIVSPVSPSDSDSDSTVSTYSNSSSTALTDNDSCSSSTSSINSCASPSIVDITNSAAADIAELEMMSKYRGLERVIFRHILQDLKINYIKRCVQEEAENCYFDSDESDMVLDDCSSCDINMNESTNPSTTGISTSNFRQYLFTSQIIAQFAGQIDRIAVVQDNYEYFLEQQRLQLERLKLARDLKKKSSSNAKWKREKSHHIDDCSNFHKQTIEI